jgi:hypothetical protein
VDRLRLEQYTKHFLICTDETKGVPAGTAGRLERFMQRLTLSVAVLPTEFTRLVPIVFTVVGTCHTKRPTQSAMDWWGRQLVDRRCPATLDRLTEEERGGPWRCLAAADGVVNHVWPRRRRVQRARDPSERVAGAARVMTAAGRRSARGI